MGRAGLRRIFMGGSEASPLGYTFTAIYNSFAICVVSKFMQIRRSANGDLPCEENDDHARGTMISGLTVLENLVLTIVNLE